MHFPDLHNDGCHYQTAFNFLLTLFDLPLSLSPRIWSLQVSTKKGGTISVLPFFNSIVVWVVTYEIFPACLFLFVSKKQELGIKFMFVMQLSSICPHEHFRYRRPLSLAASSKSTFI